MIGDGKLEYMITVIIAGGSGTRLWPLSTSNYPKHLLNLINDKSLLQAAYERAKKVGDSIYVVTELSHAHHVKEQLPELSDDAFLIEPGRRGTGNCIVFALEIISHRHDNDEPIAFVHSDHHIRDIDGYARSIMLAGEASTETKKITLIGIEPTYPSTSFGYIERDGQIGDMQDVYNIQSFKEKPDYDTAQEYMNSGHYLWNCGYFIGSVNTFRSEIRRSSPDLMGSVNKLADISYPSDQCNSVYLSLDSYIIDYSLSEKSDNLAVVAASFDWMDIGSFKDLHDVVEKDENGNYIEGEGVHAIDVENVYIRNEESKPIAVIGLDNVVVVNTPDGILVSRKDSSHRTGEVAKKLQSEIQPERS
jgi:mannose-1-phosphate guanylyltransferase/mannose-6-phosphate isomerase